MGNWIVKAAGAVSIETFVKIGGWSTFLLGLTLTLIYLYQFIFMVYALIKKPRKYQTTNQTNRYAILIAARNEEKVLPGLLKSIGEQTYPKDRLDVWVIADNCTDGTARVAESFGANVLERFHKEQIGKGYALNTLISHIRDEHGGYDAYYQGFLVIDADNVLTKNYVEEMDKAFVHSGSRIVTCYRNSKNFGDNWISAGYGLWFIRESKYLNNPRHLLGTSAAVSGTGFLFSTAIMKETDGWQNFLLTEDIEFTNERVLAGDTVAYCDDAMLYDEQPITFSQSWKQRKRWGKGMFQVYNKYGKQMLGQLFTKGKFACYDMSATTMPAFIISIITLVMNVVFIVSSILYFGNGGAIFPLLRAVGNFLMYTYVLLLVWGGITMITERKKIHCSRGKRIWYTFTFPVFMFTFLPCTICAAVSEVKWEPIHHTVVKNEDEICMSGQ